MSYPGTFGGAPDNVTLAAYTEGMKDSTTFGGELELAGRATTAGSLIHQPATTAAPPALPLVAVGVGAVVNVTTPLSLSPPGRLLL